METPERTPAHSLAPPALMMDSATLVLDWLARLVAPDGDTLQAPYWHYAKYVPGETCAPLPYARAPVARVHLPASVETADQCARELVMMDAVPTHTRWHRVALARIPNGGARFVALDIDLVGQRLHPLGTPLAFTPPACAYRAEHLAPLMLAQFESMKRAPTPDGWREGDARARVASAGWSARERLETLLTLLLLRDTTRVDASVHGAMDMQLTGDACAWWSVARLGRAISEATSARTTPGVLLSFLTDMVALVPGGCSVEAASQTLREALRTHEPGKLIGHALVDGPTVPFYDVSLELVRAWWLALVESERVGCVAMPVDASRAFWWPLNARIMLWMFPALEATLFSAPPTVTNTDAGGGGGAVDRHALRQLFEARIAQQRAHPAFFAL